MRKKNISAFLLLFVSSISFGQNYTSYFTGNANDVITQPHGGVCLMGGATEDDNAMIWFLQQANGGDVLVFRASGSDGYNNYFYSTLGVGVNSVETIVCNNAAASNEPYLHQKIQQAEAIWFAGGDQWDYISYWRNTPIDSLINEAISSRKIVIGGTSAGMAIQGGYYFSAENGTVTSATALANPYSTSVTVDSTSFIKNNYLTDVITDTHYDNPDRKGRHITFLARILTDYGIAAKGIACDEYVAVCIDTNGIAKVYGDYPSYDDNAYFIQTNCELTDFSPENCAPGTPLDWNRWNTALKVYSVKGTSNGANSLDLNDWKTGIGGTWEHWYVSSGTLNEQAGTQPDCSAASTNEQTLISSIEVYPIPANQVIYVNLTNTLEARKISVTDINGQVIYERKLNDIDFLPIELKGLHEGMYFIQISDKNGEITTVKFVKEE